jgi:hypothetical protein
LYIGSWGRSDSFQRKISAAFFLFTDKIYETKTFANGKLLLFYCCASAHRAFCQFGKVEYCILFGYYDNNEIITKKRQ